MANGWIPFYFGDYLADTSDLSLAEHGAYLLLMAHYYSTGKPLDAHASVLHRVCRCTDDAERAAVARVIERFFVMQIDAYHHKRIDEELGKSFELRDKRKKAAAIRWGNGDAHAHANGDEHDMHVDMQLDTHSHSHSQEVQDQSLLSKPSVPTLDLGFSEPEPPKNGEVKIHREAIDRVFQHYLAVTQRKPLMYTLTDLRRRKAESRLKECLKKTGGDLERATELMVIAVDGLAKSDFHMGRDAKTHGKRYCEWEDHLFGSYEQMEKWWNQE